MRYLSWCVGFAFICGCKSEKTASLPVIDPTDFQEISVFYLSEIVDSVFFIPLDDYKPLAPQTCEVLTDSNYFYAEGQGGVLMSYDLRGNFERKYGGRGHGPGEYLLLSHVCVSEAGRVYVYNSSRNTVLKYAKSGEWLGDINLDISLKGRFSDFSYANGMFFFKGCLSNECISNYLWVITDTLGHLITSRLCPENIKIYKGASRFFNLENKVGYWDAIYDTIRTLKDNGQYEANFLWNPECFEDLNLRMLEFNILPEGNVFALFWMGQKDRLRYLYYDRKQNKWLYTRNVKDDITGYEYGRDREKRTFFFKKIHYTSKGVYFTINISPLELKQWIKSNHFEKIQVKTPRFKQQLKELVERFDEEDNAVVVVYRLKK